MINMVKLQQQKIDANLPLKRKQNSKGLGQEQEDHQLEEIIVKHHIWER